MWVSVGALLAYKWDQDKPLSWYVALQVGMTAPLFLAKLGATIPDPDPGSVR